MHGSYRISSGFYDLHAPMVQRYTLGCHHRGFFISWNYRTASPMRQAGNYDDVQVGGPAYGDPGPWPKDW